MIGLVLLHWNGAADLGNCSVDALSNWRLVMKIMRIQTFFREGRKIIVRGRKIIYVYSDDTRGGYILNVGRFFAIVQNKVI